MGQSLTNIAECLSQEASVSALKASADATRQACPQTSTNDNAAHHLFQPKVIPSGAPAPAQPASGPCWEARPMLMPA